MELLVLILNRIKHFYRLHSYFFIKIFRALLTIFIILILSFIMVRSNGNPAQILLGNEATTEAVAALNHKWGLDRPLLFQFISYMKNFLHGDLGNSIIKNESVSSLIINFLPATLKLMIPSAIIAIFLGVIIGYFSVRNNKNPIDKSIMLCSTIGYSIPNFFFGVLLIYLFSIVLAILPSSGNATWKHYIMPILTISTADLAVFTRFSRATFMDIFDSSYIESSRALGISEKRIFIVHALPNAAISLLTISGFYVGSLVSGAIVTESIFSWPGLGMLLVNSIKARDFPLVQGLIFFFGVSIVCANLLVDILYGLVNPRIRKEKTK